jgi:hypothetical protein
LKSKNGEALKIETVVGITIGILMIIGLSLGLGFGVYMTYDGKNLRGLTRAYIAANENAAAAWEETGRARDDSTYYGQVAQAALERLVLCEGYAWEEIGTP